MCCLRYDVFIKAYKSLFFENIYKPALKHLQFECEKNGVLLNVSCDGYQCQGLIKLES